MNHIILDFLNAYKELDALCKQILSSDIGISKYIEEMDKKRYAHSYVFDWERDYKNLKHLRWVRNQLVHDTNSFEKKLVTSNDVEWLKRFRRRILSCSDPLSLLHKASKRLIFAILILVGIILFILYKFSYLF